MLTSGTDDPLSRLQSWYAAHTDGDWEHGYGIRIGTLDNPGWRLSVNVADTQLKGRTFARVQVERSETDWIHCWVEADVFEGAGGAHNLRELVETFLRWADEPA
jgi:hypothetical protein